MPFERALKSCLEKSLPMLRECAQRLHDKYRHQTNRLAKLFSTARHSLLDSTFFTTFVLGSSIYNSKSNLVAIVVYFCGGSTPDSESYFVFGGLSLSHSHFIRSTLTPLLCCIYSLTVTFRHCFSFVFFF